MNKKLNIRKLNTITLGLLFGSLFGYVALQIIQTFAELFPHPVPEWVSIFKGIIYLGSCYLGVILTSQADEELNFCIPFVRLNSQDQRRKDILLDPSLLNDPRLIDLAKSGLLNHQLVFPHSGFEQYGQSLEILKKLQEIPDLELRMVHDDFPEIQDPHSKLIQLAKKLRANILTTDANPIPQDELGEIKFININILSQALKPTTSAGEQLTIKIQRFGREPRQGVGYLEDGTMVVVNGGAEYIGKTIKVVVLSIMRTTSGRMIFCNTLDAPSEELDSLTPDLATSLSSYY